MPRPIIFIIASNIKKINTNASSLSRNFYFEESKSSEFKANKIFEKIIYAKVNTSNQLL